MAASTLRDYAHLSPFEIKDELIRLARQPDHAATHALLNAGRGNPNWIATRARHMFFLLGQFGLTEAQRVMTHDAGLAGMPEATGIANRLRDWLTRHDGADAERLIDFALQRFNFRPDDFVHELTDAIIGDNYPVPDRMLRHAEPVVHDYLLQVLGGSPGQAGRFELFATEGATAAICNIFRSLKANRLLRAGDRIAIGTPIFTPYLELPRLEDYDLVPVYLTARSDNNYQFTAQDLGKLDDRRIKALFLVNPGNPTSVAISPELRGAIADLVHTRRPDLMLITDDVYAGFVTEFRSLLMELPRNTIGVYSWSKYFGCTGWRLGVVAVQQDNVFDAAIAALPEAEARALDRRYGALVPEVRRLRFIDRLVADSRDVALNHTAGLSPPQQAMMTLFSLAELADRPQAYRRACTAILHRRAEALAGGLGLPAQSGPLVTSYYGLIDLADWLREFLGDDVAEFVERTVHPLDIVFRLAREYGIVVLNGGGFHAPDWSVRVSFANLNDAAYHTIGRAIRAIARDYVAAWDAAQVSKTGDHSMNNATEVLDAVRHAVHSEPRVRPTAGPLHFEFDHGDLVIAGEVDHIAGKKLALEAAARVAGVGRIVDRLHVRPPIAMGDGEIRDQVRDALLEESALGCCTIRVWDQDRLVVVRAPPDADGTLDVRVEDGIVTLDGDVVGSGLKRLAGVLAWWVPGSRDVINGIAITPPEADSEAAMTDAVLQVLEKDPFVDAASIRVHSRRGVVTLDGVVPRATEVQMAEDDAWYVFGVDKVVNRLIARA